MPKRPNTQHFSNDEWEERRKRIRDLFEQVPLKGAGGVIDTMTNEGFPATFRAWGVKKYKKRGKPEETTHEIRQGETTQTYQTSEFQEGAPPTEIGNTADTMDVDVEEEIFPWTQSTQHLISPNEDFNIADWDMTMTDSSEYSFPLHGLSNPFWDMVSSSGNVSFPMSVNSRQVFLPALPSTQLVVAMIETSTSHNLTHLLSVLHRLYSPKFFVGEDWSRLRELPVEVELDARFDGRLIASIVNGYTVLNCLNAQRSPVAKSFTENIFLAYLEADNAVAIKSLLDSGWVNANEAVCHYHGERYTPLEIAAIKQSFKVLRLLIDQGVNTNKSFLRASHDNALHLLIEHVEDRRSTLEDNMLSLVDTFLKAKAAVLIDTIYMALRAFTDPRLAVRLIEYFAFQTPHKLISREGLLKSILQNFDKQHATSMVSLIVRKCQELGKFQYLDRFSQDVKYVLGKAVDRGYDDVKPTYDLDENHIFDVPAALDAALAHDFDDLAWSLLDVGITIRPASFKYSCEDSLLYVAVKNNRLDFVKVIVESGLLRSDADLSPIIEAALRCDGNSMFDEIWAACPRPVFYTEGLLKLALETRGKHLFLAIVDAGPPEATFAMKVAVECENESLLDELISHGVSADNEYVLLEAVENHHSMIIPLLHRYRKAFPKGRAGYGGHIVLSALEKHSTTPELLDMAFAWNLVGPNINRTFTNKETFLRKAIETHDCLVVKRFIDAGSNVNSTMMDNRRLGVYCQTTPLLNAIKTQIVEMVELLIDRGADVNKAATYGIRRTPLQMAVEMNNMAIVRLLLSRGADVNAIPSRYGGATALQIAAIQGDCEMAKVLIEHGAQNDITRSAGRHGRMPLEGAAENGRLDMIELLWRAFDGRFDDDQCRNAIRRAERYGHFGCKEMIEEFMRSSARNRIALPTLS
ncbi:uncharacterized protein F4812DRAFT_452331 [Daldinia caldariorum]|uniref:uncharacterized protein n=1 Tax=Daldinia caldariorum TaxID=326644 RepID=UPI0020081DC3|nr:uncharacterized protein F4812DRAFT_452331 [Daldinia caldariorum]KAI1465356.1 hypothetical protein F4812DRAFT_452331 [Daldinia caldariorum]